MVQYNRNTTGGIPAWSTTVEFCHADREEEPFRGVLRYSCGAPIPGMEYQPDYFNGKYEPPKVKLCQSCGKTRSHAGRGIYCQSCISEKRAIGGRHKTNPRAICAD